MNSTLINEELIAEKEAKIRVERNFNNENDLRILTKFIKTGYIFWDVDIKGPAKSTAVNYAIEIIKRYNEEHLTP